MPRDKNSGAAFAGLAATGSLLAATAAAALVVGGLLGFGAFPGAADEAQTAPLRVAPAPAGATARAPIVVARAAHRPPRRSLHHPAREQTVRAPRRHRGLPTAPPAPAHGAGTAATATVPAPGPPARAPSGGALNPPATDGGPLAPAVHAARDAGATVTAAVGPVAPASTGPIETASASVAGAVEQADHAAAATVGTLGR
jgi:putative peptidoglycan lipid II flippase